MSGIEGLAGDVAESLVDISSGEVENVKERMERHPTMKVALSPRGRGHSPNVGLSSANA